jgi:hypothetical protein
MPKRRKNAYSLEFYGASDLLKKIEAAGGDVENAISQAVVRSMASPKNDLQAFMTSHHLTGVTERSWGETSIEWKNGKLEYAVGFNLKKGGIGALFLDVGTPKQSPTYFIYNTVQRNLTKIRDAQQQALQEIFKELL